MKVLSHLDFGYTAFVRRLKRRALPEAAVRDLVAEIIAHVAAKGDEALITFTRRFDGAVPPRRHFLLRRRNLPARKMRLHRPPGWRFPAV